MALLSWASVPRIWGRHKVPAMSIVSSSVLSVVHQEEKQVLRGANGSVCFSNSPYSSHPHLLRTDGLFTHNNRDENRCALSFAIIRGTIVCPTNYNPRTTLIECWECSIKQNKSTPTTVCVSFLVGRVRWTSPGWQKSASCAWHSHWVCMAFTLGVGCPCLRGLFWSSSCL